MAFFPEMELSKQSAEAIARGLYAVAKVDGVHDREAGLIASFWIDAGGGEHALSDLERAAAMTPSELATLLASEAERKLFLKTALLLTWADGKVSSEERACVGAFAQALGVDAAALEGLEAGVKDYLLGHLAHLQNTDATRAVAKKLDL